jgi:hypothetical protein
MLMDAKIPNHVEDWLRNGRWIVFNRGKRSSLCNAFAGHRGTI